MGVHVDVRSLDEKLCDMLADEWTFAEISRRTGYSELALRSRFTAICRQMGESSDG